jgi:hypothetical protein
MAQGRELLAAPGESPANTREEVRRKNGPICASWTRGARPGRTSLAIERYSHHYGFGNATDSASI